MPLQQTLAAASVRGFQSLGPNIPADAKMLTILDILKLRTGLQICLDAGDPASYPGTGQTWSDVSGNNLNFYRGAASGSGADDPTFVGPAGNKGAYFSFDGGDRFSLVGANTNWMNGLHNAGAKFTFMCWVYLTSITEMQGIISTLSAAGAGTGISWRAQDGYLLQHVFNNNSLVHFSGPRFLKLNQWQMLGISADESAGVCIHQNNDLFLEISDLVYQGPSAAAASGVMTIGAQGNGSVGLLKNESRIANVMGWDRALSRSEMTIFFRATRKNYGV